MIYHILLILSVILSYEIITAFHFKADLKRILIIYKKIFLNFKRDKSDSFKEKIILLLSKHLFFKSLKILIILLLICLLFYIFYFFERGLIKVFYDYTEILKFITIFLLYYYLKKKFLSK
jgi:hypothetical protein